LDALFARRCACGHTFQGTRRVACCPRCGAQLPGGAPPRRPSIFADLGASFLAVAAVCAVVSVVFLIVV